MIRRRVSCRRQQRNARCAGGDEMSSGIFHGNSDGSGSLAMSASCCRRRRRDNVRGRELACREVQELVLSVTVNHLLSRLTSA